jgi:hypothetical protein
MKTIYIFYSQTEAQFAQQYLMANGIEAHIVGAKNYEAIVAGGSSGRYEMKVADLDLVIASDLLSKKLNRPMLAEVENDEQTAVAPATTVNFKPNYFRKSVMYALCAIFLLPLVFNIVSLINAKLYWQTAKKDIDRSPKMILLVALQVPGIATLWFVYDFVRSMWPI